MNVAMDQLSIQPTPLHVLLVIMDMWPPHKENWPVPLVPLDPSPQPLVSPFVIHVVQALSVTNPPSLNV